MRTKGTRETHRWRQTEDGNRLSCDSMLRIIRRITPYAHARSKETPQGKVQGGEKGSPWKGQRGALVYG